MKPKYMEGQKCEECGDRDTVSLYSNGNAVIWCACGAVTVVNVSKNPQDENFCKVVYKF